MMQRREECSSSKLFYFLADTGDGDEREMHGKKTSIGHGVHSHDCLCGGALGMCKGIDTPLCSRSNRHMDSCTTLPYFPNQRLSGSDWSVAVVF